MSLDGRGTASIAVKGPHVSLCRRGKSPLQRVGRRRLQNPRSPGDMRANFTFEAQISGQTDGWPRVGAKKASNEVVKFWLLGFWPTQVRASTAFLFVSLGSFAAHQSPTTSPIPTPPGLVNYRRLFDPSFSYIFGECKLFGLRGLAQRKQEMKEGRSTDLSGFAQALPLIHLAFGSFAARQT